MALGLGGCGLWCRRPGFAPHVNPCSPGLSVEAQELPGLLHVCSLCSLLSPVVAIAILVLGHFGGLFLFVVVVLVFLGHNNFMEMNMVWK